MNKTTIKVMIMSAMISLASFVLSAGAYLSWRR